MEEEQILKKNMSVLQIFSNACWFECERTVIREMLEFRIVLGNVTVCKMIKP